MIRRPPRSPLFPTRRSSDLIDVELGVRSRVAAVFNRERDELIAMAVNQTRKCATQLAALGERECSQSRAAGRTRIRNCLREIDRKSTRLNSSHSQISYAVFC